MTFTLAQRREANNGLLPDVHDFIISNETTDFVTQSIQSLNLNDEQSDSVDSEILYALLNLQTLDMAIKNIAVLIQKPEETLSKFKSELQKNIFKKIYDLNIESVRAVGPSDATPDNVVALPELSPDLLPEILPGQTAHDVPREQAKMNNVTTDNKPPITRNENGRPNLEFPQSGYQKGKDPYREPIE